MNKIHIAIILIFSSFSLFGQTKKAFTEAGEKAFVQKNYYAALTYFNEVLEFDSKDINALRKSAIAAREFNAYDIAVKKYTFLIDSLGNSSDSTEIYHTAMLFQRMGKYDKATEYFERYITEYGNDEDTMTIRAKAGKEASVWASSRIKELDESVTITRRADDVNSNYSDFGGAYLADSLFYSSMRFIEEDSKEDPPKQLSKILTKGDGGSEPVDFDFNKLNQSIANLTFNDDKTKAYYTVCEYISESELRCDIYQAIVQNDGVIAEGRILPSAINDSTFTSTHPFVTIDPSTDNEILYFASDRPGGKGGLDLWYSINDKKLGFSKPINLSSLNTPLNEATPFYHKESKALYFSSEGHLGLGGYDVYESFYDGGIYTEPNALPPPTNSSYHDLYYFLDDEGENGLLSSNREGASYIDDMLKACCFDIYELEIEPQLIDLLALTFDKLTNLELNGATVDLLDSETGDLISTVTVDTTHEHLFKVKKNKRYLVVGSKPGYISDTVNLSTFNLETNEPLEEKLYLESEGVVLDIFTFDADTKEALNGATVTLEDLTDPTMNQVIRVNKESNNFSFQLDKDKSYKITAKKNGYTSVSEIIDTRGVTGKISRNLFLKVFDLGAYLPITLYFDNDEPDPDAMTTSTDKVYGDLIEAFMLRKKKYKEVYGKGAVGNTKQESVERMEEFFEGDVKGGFDQLKVFMNGLISELESGKRIDMTIRGFASPRFNVKYNLVLAQRRITSVRNEMMRYKGGAIKPFLESKQLILTEISFGEELSPSDVNDNIHDEKESIYSYTASKQRRVEVVSVISK